jgi:ATPase subunit of ABC transporter with duplicated ATPase domains
VTRLALVLCDSTMTPYHTMNATVVSQTWKRDAGSVTGLDLGVSAKRLLTGATFTIGVGDHVAVLGRNGCGKTTLFSWIRDAAASGPWSVYEVAQELPVSAQSVLAVVLGAHLERGRMWARIGELEAEDYEMTGVDLEEHGRLHDELMAAGADSDEARASKILNGLGFSLADMRRPVSEFSGGWRARVALAQGLFMEPDLLLLDEPTNHLDLEGVVWLSEFMKGLRSAVVVISHNRGFVREVANSIWEIVGGRLRVYKCRYDRYLKQRALDEKAAEKAWAALEKEVTALKGKGTPQARKAAEELLAKRAREGVVRPEAAYRPRFFFIESGEGGSEDRLLIRTDEADLGYDGHVVLDRVTFGLYGGCRVALVGGNGSGKSTLLKFLVGELPAVSGHVTRRPGLRICKFDQHFYHTLPADKTPIEYVMSVAHEGGIGAPAMVRKILGGTGLKGAEQSQPIGTLSGGQKARVYFASLAVQAPDVLLMDEPTNHLDIETIDGLAAALVDFQGAAVIVSHDLDFLETVATEVWMTANGRLERLGEGVEGLEEYVDTISAE